MTDPHAILVAGLAYGDCGKGTVVDFLTRRHAAHTVVRYNGGPQAAHNVVTPGGRHHTFSQFGAGAFVPGVRTLLSRFVLIEPYALLNEAAHLIGLGETNCLGRLMIDEQCPVITPAHQAANRLREIARGSAAHGTCGMGIGETMQDVLNDPAAMLYARDLRDRRLVARKLRAICDAKAAELPDLLYSLQSHGKARFSIETLADPSWIETAVNTYAHVGSAARIVDADDVRNVLNSRGTTVFEGAQGVLLDEFLGFHPHTTWSTTTFANAQALLDENGYTGRRTRLGVLRCYSTRHGAGPLVTEDAALRSALTEAHNADEGWQGKFRVGVFDAVAARYALAAAGPVDALAITHLDRMKDLPSRICTAYVAESTIAGDALDEFFVHQGGRITDIRAPGIIGDYAASERRTGMLGRLRPTYQAIGTDVAGFLDLVVAELGKPIGITSAGPTASDKQVKLAGL